MLAALALRVSLGHTINACSLPDKFPQPRGETLLFPPLLFFLLFFFLFLLLSFLLLFTLLATTRTCDSASCWCTAAESTQAATDTDAVATTEIPNATSDRSKSSVYVTSLCTTPKKKKKTQQQILPGESKDGLAEKKL